MPTDNEIELRKLKSEKTKTIWTAAAVIVSVLSAAGTIAYNVYSLRQTAEDQLMTKVVEITFNAESPDAAASKAAGIAYLYGDHLPQDIRAKLVDREAVIQTLTSNLGKGPAPETRKEVLRMVLAAKPDQEGRILKTWKRMFSGDKEWIDAFAKAKD